MQRKVSFCCCCLIFFHLIHSHKVAVFLQQVFVSSVSLWLQIYQFLLLLMLVVVESVSVRPMYFVNLMKLLVQVFLLAMQKKV